MLPNMIRSVILLLFALAPPGQETPSPTTASERREAIEAWQSSVEMGRSLVKDRPCGEFLELPFDELPPKFRIPSYPLARWVYQQDVAPFEKGGVPIRVKEDSDLRVRVYASRSQQEDDLIEFCWSHHDRLIRVVASRNAMQIDFGLQHLPECRSNRDGDCVDALKQWVGETLKLEGEHRMFSGSVEYKVELPWPESLEDGISFSSAPERNLTRLSGGLKWYQRVDVFVANGTVSILIYNKIGQLMHFLPGAGWFPEDFRAEVHERVRQRDASDEWKESQEKGE